MRVARHEMPGRCQRKRPPQRDGMIGSANGTFLIWGMIEPRYEIIPSLTGRIRCCAHSRHFMPGLWRAQSSRYPRPVPPGRSACPLNCFSTDRAISRQRETPTRRAMLGLWVHFWSQKKFPEGFAEVKCITGRERGSIGLRAPKKAPNLAS
jgi:hypothetical protein